MFLICIILTYEVIILYVNHSGNPDVIELSGHVPTFTMEMNSKLSSRARRNVYKRTGASPTIATA